MDTPAHILVATDLSARSVHAVERAHLLAEQQGATLSLLYILEEDLPEELLAILEVGARKILQDQLTSFALSHSSVQVARGRVAPTIVETARRLGADLIVLGTHRADPIRDFWQAKTAGRVVADAPCPVLVVRSRPESRYRRAVVGMDLSRNAINALEYAMRSFPDASLDVVHAYQTPFPGFIHDGQSDAETDQDHQAGLARVLARELADNPADLAQRLTPVLIRNEPIPGLLEVLETREADLLVIGGQGTSDMIPTRIGMHTRNLLEMAPCDLLVVPEKFPEAATATTMQAG